MMKGEPWSFFKVCFGESDHVFVAGNVGAIEENMGPRGFVYTTQNQYILGPPRANFQTFCESATLWLFDLKRTCPHLQPFSWGLEGLPKTGQYSS